LVAAGLLLAIGLAEVALWIAGVGHPAFYLPDRFSGATHRPGAAGWYRHEGEAYVRINSAGLRDREHARPKPPGTFRVAFLGDSYTEAFQVDASQAFWAVAERELAQCPALATRGLGVPARRDTPSRRSTSACRGVLDDSFLESPEWRRTQAWWWRAKDVAVAKLRTLQVIYEARNALLRNRLAPTQVEGERPIYRPPPDERWSRAWDVTERMLRLLRDEVVAGGARFELLVLTNWRQVHPDLAVRAHEVEAMGAGADLLYPDRRLEAFANAEGIEVLTLVRPLAAEAEARDVCLHGFPNAVPCGGHWNVEGHRLGGQHLATALCEQLGRDSSAGDHRGGGNGVRWAVESVF
jgi:hypothetical protein